MKNKDLALNAAETACGFFILYLTICLYLGMFEMTFVKMVLHVLAIVGSVGLYLYFDSRPTKEKAHRR